MTVDLTIEVECIASSEATKEVVCIRKVILELRVVPRIIDIVLLYYDNN